MTRTRDRRARIEPPEGLRDKFANASLREMQQARERKRQDARAILDATEGRSLTAAEESKFDALMDERDALDKLIDEKGLERERERERAAIGDDRFGGSGSVVFEDSDGQRIRGYLPEERLADASDDHPLGRALLAAVTGQRHERDMGISVDPAGGFFVSDELSSQLIDLARSEAILTRAGAVTVPVTTKRTEIVRLVGDPSGAWRSEHGTVASTDLTLGRIALDVQSIAAMVTLSEELAMDAPNAPAVVESALSSAVAAQLDRAFIRGGADLPSMIGTGLLDDPDVHTVALNAAPTNYDPYTNAIGEIWGSNLEPAVRIDSARTATDLAKLKNADQEQLPQPAEVAALRHIRSNQVPTDLGVGDDESVSVVGHFGMLGAGVLLAVRQGLRIDATRTAGDAFDKLQLKIRIWGRFGFAIARPSGIALVTGIKPAA